MVVVARNKMVAYVEVLKLLVVLLDSLVVNFLVVLRAAQNVVVIPGRA